MDTTIIFDRSKFLHTGVFFLLSTTEKAPRNDYNRATIVWIPQLGFARGLEFKIRSLDPCPDCIVKGILSHCSREIFLSYLGEAAGKSVWGRARTQYLWYPCNRCATKAGPSKGSDRKLLMVF